MQKLPLRGCYRVTVALRHHPHVHPPLQLSDRGGGLNLVSGWVRKRKSPAVCQLLISFPVSPNGEEKKNRIVMGLLKLSYYMNSCVIGNRGESEGCTFFSTVHCNERHLKWPEV